VVLVRALEHGAREHERSNGIDRLTDVISEIFPVAERLRHDRLGARAAVREKTPLAGGQIPLSCPEKMRDQFDGHADPIGNREARLEVTVERVLRAGSSSWSPLSSTGHGPADQATVAVGIACVPSSTRRQPEDGVEPVRVLRPRWRSA
jgi:hypothetical protein